MPWRIFTSCKDSFQQHERPYIPGPRLHGPSTTYLFCVSMKECHILFSTCATFCNFCNNTGRALGAYYIENPEDTAVLVSSTNTITSASPVFHSASWRTRVLSLRFSFPRSLSRLNRPRRVIFINSSMRPSTSSAGRLSHRSKLRPQHQSSTSYRPLPSRRS